MANLYYRNSVANISFELVDSNNNYIELSGQAIIYWYIKTPDNFILSNDPNIASGSFANGTAVYSSSPAVQQQSTGVYSIDYVFTKIGEYKYKFQVIDDMNSMNLSSSGSVKVIDDGIF